MPLTLLHPERPKLYTILAFLSAVGLRATVRIVAAHCAVDAQCSVAFSLAALGSSALELPLYHRAIVFISANCQQNLLSKIITVLLQYIPILLASMLFGFQIV